MRYATLVDNSTKSISRTKNLILSMSRGANLYLRYSKVEDYAGVSQIFDTDVQVFVFNPECDDIDYFLHVVQETKVERSILLLTKPWQDIEHVWMTHLVDKPNLLLYLAYLSEGSVLYWHKVLTLKSGYTINELKFEKNSLKMIEDLNLNGLKISSISLSWPPFLTIDGCDEKGTNCKNHFGYLVDYLDALAKDLNFTYDSYKDLGTNTNKHVG